MRSSLGLEMRLLGPLEVRGDGVPVAVRGRRPRALLCVLALAGGRPVTADIMTDRIWGEAGLPADVRGSLHTYVHRLRTALGAAAVVAGDGGYRLAVEPEAVDAVQFTRLLTGVLPPTYDALEQALALWRDTRLPSRSPTGSPSTSSRGSWNTT